MFSEKKTVTEGSVYVEAVSGHVCSSRSGEHTDLETDECSADTTTGTELRIHTFIVGIAQSHGHVTIADFL